MKAAKTAKLLIVWRSTEWTEPVVLSSEWSKPVVLATEWSKPVVLALESKTCLWTIAKAGLRAVAETSACASEGLMGISSVWSADDASRTTRSYQNSVCWVSAGTVETALSAETSCTTLNLNVCTKL